MRFEINGLAGWVGSFLPRVTIDDLVSVALGYARGWLKAALQTALDEALIAAYVIDNDELKVQIRALKEIFQIVLTPTPEMKGEPLLISPGDLFPDISGLLASGLGAAIRKHGSEVAAGLTATLASGGAAVIAAGEAFRTAGARAAFIDSPAKFQKIFDDSAAVADYLTQGERSALQERLAKPDELAAGFEKALIGGGFDIVGDCISFYLKAVREHWDQNLKSPARAAKPTSPHILQKRKSLGRVRLPALTVTARGYKLDSDLITEIASRFKTAVQEAYRKGMVRPEAARSRWRSPRPISSWSQEPRSCSARSRMSPPSSTRAGNRLAWSSMRARRACTAGRSVAGFPARISASRIASPHSSARVRLGPPWAL